MIIGLPDEKEEDMLQTLELMDKLKGYNAFYVPLFFVPLENCVLMNKKGAEMDSLSKARWDFFIKCWEYNIKIWKPTFLENRLPNPLMYKTFDQVHHSILRQNLGRILWLNTRRKERTIQAGCLAIKHAHA